MSWTLTNADCIAAMQSMPDKAYDLAIVDPPYGIGESGEKNHTRGKLAVSKSYKPFFGGDVEPPSAEYFNELRRVSRNQIVWGANHFIDRIATASPCWIVWDKENGTSDFADCELAYTSFRTAVRMFRFRWQGMLQGDMANKESRLHPTQKPVALYKWLLKNYAKPNDRILDTHGGSCSSVIAAIDMGFSIDAYELDPDYYAQALKRIHTHELQPRLIPTEQPTPIQTNLL